jgi:hypothetical protein
LMNAPPSTALCGDNELPVRAELRWTVRGSIAFELTGVLKREKADLPTAALLVPPSSSSFTTSPLPTAGVSAALAPAELAAFRTGPIDIPQAPVPPGPPPTDGLVIANSTDQLRVVCIDGIFVAWVAPGAKAELPGLLRGRYIIQGRTFLGDTFDTPVTQVVPGVFQLTAAGTDAGIR